jgi:hypothetical protein
MRRADVSRSEHAPLRIEPRFGQVRENGSKVRVSKETWDVLQERVSGSNVANAANRIGPEVPLVVDSKPLPCLAERLARESRSDDIHDSSPRLSIEGSDVSPDGERLKAPIILSLHKNPLTVGIDFNSADRFEAKENPPKYSAASPSKESELVHLSASSRGNSRVVSPF